MVKRFGDSRLRFKLNVSCCVVYDILERKTNNIPESKRVPGIPRNVSVFGNGTKNSAECELSNTALLLLVMCMSV